MPTELLTAPVAEPVTVAEAKAHMRIDHTADDAIIPDMITAAREWVERATGLALITETWRLTLDSWPQTAVELRPAPVQSISAVKTFGVDGASTTLANSAYELVSVGRSARMVRTLGSSWVNPARAAGGIEIDFTAGYGDEASDVPRMLRQALLMVLAHHYENRELLDGGSASVLPAGVEALLAPFREPKL